MHHFQEVSLFAPALPARAVKIKTVRHTRSPESADSFFCHFNTLRKMPLLTVCLLVQSAMCFKVSVTHTLTVSINLCKEWAKA